MLPLLREALSLPASVVVSSITINLLGLVLPLVVLQIFDRVLKNQALNTLTLLIFGLFLAVAAETALRFARNTLISRTALNESFNLHMQVISRFLRAPRTETAKLPADAAADAMSAADEMGQFLSGSGRLALLDFPFVLLFLGIIWAIGGAIVVLPSVLIVIFATWTIRTSTNFKRLLNDQVQLERERFGFYAECLKGIATVKSLAIEPQMQRRLERLLQANAAVNYQLVLRSNRMIAAGQLFANLTMVSVVSVGGLLAIKGLMSVGAVAACSLIANRVTQPVLRLIGVWGQMEAARFAQDRFAPIMNLAPEPPMPQRTDPAEVELVKAAMSAGDLDGGIDLIVKPGEVVGIVGHTFAERAQLIALLRGTLRPDRGTVLVDGVDLAGPDGEAAQQGVYYIGNEPVVFDGTILDNISMYRRVSHAAAVEVASRLGLEPIIQTLPDGYDTRLGDIRASALPRDILQAICVVRAAAIKPRVLLMDLRRVPPDDISTRACERAIAELRGTTTVIVFGKLLREVKDAGRILALQDWRLNELSTTVQLNALDRIQEAFALDHASAGADQ